MTESLFGRGSIDFCNKIGPHEKCRPRPPMSAVEGGPEDFCSLWGLPVLRSATNSCTAATSEWYSHC